MSGPAGTASSGFHVEATESFILAQLHTMTSSACKPTSLIDPSRFRTDLRKALSTSALTGNTAMNATASSDHTGPGSWHQHSSSIVGVWVAITIIFILLLLFTFAECVQYYRRKFQPQAQNTSRQLNYTQPYLQPKGELEAEDKRKHELSAHQTKCELGEEHGIYEISTSQVRSGSFNPQRQELRGEEHCQELDCLKV